MVVLRQYKFANGDVKDQVDPDYERRYREHLMTSSAHPSWKEDPTYNMSRRKR